MGPDPLPPFPERVGRYELLMPIGVGGMATVFLARMEGVGGFEREVALKLMHAHLRLETRFTQDLLHEARIAARIRHPNVVPVIDVGDDPFGAFLVMDYVEGDTIAQLLRLLRAEGRALPLGLALRIVIDALAGLHAVHEQKDDEGELYGLVHRDFSPQNILVGVDGVTRLTDFGIAKSTNRDLATRTGIVKGKLGYMSPEQARGRALDRRCDVWAAGVVAWELVTGQRLLPPGDDMDRLMQLVNEDRPRARSVRADVPRALDDALAQALARDVNARLGSADELRRLLIEAQAPADPAELAALAAGVLGPKLEDRKRRAQEVSKLRIRMTKLVTAGIESVSLATHSSHEIASADKRDEPTTPLAQHEATVVQVVEPAPRPRRRLQNIVVALGAIGLAAFAVERVLATQAPREEPAPREVAVPSEPSLAPQATAAPSVVVEEPAASVEPPAKVAPPARTRSPRAAPAPEPARRPPPLLEDPLDARHE
jgi:serine/threonine-protein kinase